MVIHTIKFNLNSGANADNFQTIFRHFGMIKIKQSKWCLAFFRKGGGWGSIILKFDWESQFGMLLSNRIKLLHKFPFGNRMRQSLSIFIYFHWKPTSKIISQSLCITVAAKCYEISKIMQPVSVSYTDQYFN